MALLIGCAFLLGGVNAFLAASSSFNISSSLASLTDPLRVVFIDFDRTLAVGNVGEMLLTEWCPECAQYSPSPAPCACDAEATTFADFMAANASRVLEEGGNIINGTDRRDRLAQTFELLQSKNITISVLSTSHYDVSAEGWGNLIAKVLEIANLDQYIPRDQIYTLADPGLDIPADKTQVMADYLASIEASQHEGLFVDDSPSNVVAAAGTIDYLHVFPREGLTVDQLEWIEARANPVNCSALSPPANGAIGTCTPTVRTGETCSITCEDGWVLTGGATQTCKATHTNVSTFTVTQTCEAAVCSPLTVPEHGSANTCNTTKTTGEECSFACDDGYVLSGNASLPCVATGPGTSAYEGSQTCEAATCASPVVVNGTAGSCTGQTTNQSCSITCATGFAVSGPSSQTCLPSGPGTSAYPDTQSCVALCLPLAAPLHGSANTCNSSKSIGETCSFACDDGYILSGNASSCVQTGAAAEYESTQTCQAATCASPVVVNGTAGSCTGQTTNQSCSIKCVTGFAVSGPSSQTCLPSGPGTSAYPDTQSCVAVPSACPVAAISLFLNACSNNSISGGCSSMCATTGTMLSRDFAALKETAQFVEACIRNQTTFDSANTDLVITRLKNGGSLCAINGAQASNALFAVFFSVATALFAF